jgi:threonylcarbamoyladenosine tRNA methylthiotransferase MtaB
MRSEDKVRIHVSSLGCKLNQNEMETLSDHLARGGHQMVATPAEADMCVLNTCAVTHVAAQKSRQALRRLHRENPDARLVATGCYAELTPADLRGLPGVEIVAGNQDKENLAALIGPGEPEPTPRLVLHSPFFASHTARTRAMVKIQDGCDNACTYCIIHVARGAQRSRPMVEILAKVRDRLAAGYQEIVLTGVHIGAYGQDQGSGESGTDLWALVARILAETPLPRLRLSSVEPWDLSEHAFDLWSDARLCRHLHLPLQSGCDATLRRMNRRYTTAQFAGLVDAAHAAIPGLAVTTDLIVGFPSETEAEFAQSLAFVQEMGFARVHVFPYSVRPGTPAAKMPGQVPSPIKAERALAMRQAAAASAQAFRERYIGEMMDVLWESSRPGDSGPIWSGLTDNYLRVRAVSSRDLANQLLPTKLVALTEKGLQGQIDPEC